jgi:transposase
VLALRKKGTAIVRLLRCPMVTIHSAVRIETFQGRQQIGETATKSLKKNNFFKRALGYSQDIPLCLLSLLSAYSI